MKVSKESMEFFVQPIFFCSALHFCFFGHESEIRTGRCYIQGLMTVLFCDSAA